MKPLANHLHGGGHGWGAVTLHRQQRELPLRKAQPTTQAHKETESDREGQTHRDRDRDRGRQGAIGKYMKTTTQKHERDLIGIDSL